MTCPECNAENPPDRSCEMHFHTLLAWEWQYNMQEVHHLLVLCYHLQHPSLYSPEALTSATQQLVEFVEEGISPQQMRASLQQEVASDTRIYKIRGTPEHHGQYQLTPAWTMTIGDVVTAGYDSYYASVERWARSILRTLRASENLS